MVFGLMDFQVHIPQSVNPVAAQYQRRATTNKPEESMRRKSLLARSLSLSLGILFLMSFACLTIFGQAGTSTVRGTVTDPQGNVVAGATITLTDTNKNSSRTATSEDNGAYRFELVPVGDYRLEVEAKGFKKSVVSSVHAAVGSPNPVDVKLEVGNVSETVTVSAGAGEQLRDDDPPQRGERQRGEAERAGGHEHGTGGARLEHTI